MKYTATIEIPKGSNRRTHLAYDKSGFVDLGLIKDRIPVNDGVMPVAYGVQTALEYLKNSLILKSDL